MSTKLHPFAVDSAGHGNPTCQEYAPYREITTDEDNYTNQEITGHDQEAIVYDQETSEHDYESIVHDQETVVETAVYDQEAVVEIAVYDQEAVVEIAVYDRETVVETAVYDQETTEYGGTATNDNVIAYKTSTVWAALPEITEEDIDGKVKQLAVEFSAHLKAELSDGAQRDFIEKWIRYYVTTHEDAVVSEALQAVAANFATHIRNNFGEELQKEIPVAVAAPWRVQLGSCKLETELEYQDFLEDFTTQHLSQFYDSNDKSIQEVASNAAKRVRKETGISHKPIPGLAKLALYDFIFLCDDSGSMQEEDRILALRDTLGRVAKFATILNSSGISIRMLNYNHDENGIWDHLSTVDDVIRKMDKVSYTGGTPLGTRLWSKILKPLIIDKASSGELKKPVIVIVITDGEANNEAPTQLRDKIYLCNERMRDLGYGDAAVVFLISRVGTSEYARVFIENLGKDEYIGKTVYVSPADLQLKRAAFQNSGNDVAYTEVLIQLFLAALHVRTQT